MKKNICIALMVLFDAQLQHAVLVKGDQLAASGDTFSFDIGFANFDSGSKEFGGRLWMANNDDNMSSYSDQVKPFGLSYVSQVASYDAINAQPQAAGMVSQGPATLCTFDGTTAAVQSVAQNPLWGATFSQFSLYQNQLMSANKPLFVLKDQPSLVYLVEDIAIYPEGSDQKNKTDLLVTDIGSGSSIVDLYGAPFAAYVASSSGTFGQDDSKIIELVRREKTVNEQAVPCLVQSATGSIGVDTPVFKGGDTQPNLDSMASFATMQAVNTNLYIGISGQASNTSGACAIGMATIVKGSTEQTASTLSFKPIVPTSLAITGIDTALSAAAGNAIKISNITSMKTSTRLDYILFARSNPNDASFPQIYALPLVSSGADIGKIADFRMIKNMFSQAVPSIFYNRNFTTLVSNVDDIDPAGPYRQQLLVGNGDGAVGMPDFPLQRLFCVGDTAYITLGDASTPDVPYGTFKSQAIFAQDGHIVEWSEWSQVLGSELSMLYSSVDPQSISGYYVAHKNQGNYRSVVQTTFAPLPVSYVAPVVGEGFLSSNIQGLFSFGSETAGFTCSYSMMIATLNNQVVMAQTGTHDGSYHTMLTPIEAFVLSGEQVANQQAMVAAEIAHDVNNGYHWIFVGGDSGLAVYVNDQGITWAGGLNDLSGLQNGQVFQKVGNFTFIKKLVWDASSSYLYVLTVDSLYRIALDPLKFAANTTEALNPELLLTASKLTNSANYFLDFIIDDGFYILGTTSGMYSGDFVLQKTPVKIYVPSGLPAVSNFIVVSPESIPRYKFKTLGNLIVLNNTFGSQQARINRFVIQNGNVVPFDDFLIADPLNMQTGIATSFLKFNNYVSSYYTNGSWNLAATYYLGMNQPENSAATPSILQILAGVAAGNSSSQVIMPKLTKQAPLYFINSGVNLGGNVAQCTTDLTSGSLIVYGSFTAMANF